MVNNNGWDGRETETENINRDEQKTASKHLRTEYLLCKNEQKRFHLKSVHLWAECNPLQTFKALFRRLVLVLSGLLDIWAFHSIQILKIVLQLKGQE